jgi:hypothetical protein
VKKQRWTFASTEQHTTGHAIGRTGYNPGRTGLIARGELEGALSAHAWRLWIYLCSVRDADRFARERPIALTFALVEQLTRRPWKAALRQLVRARLIERAPDEPLRVGPMRIFGGPPRGDDPAEILSVPRGTVSWLSIPCEVVSMFDRRAVK